MKRSISSEDGSSKKRPSSAVAGITKSISACKRCRLKKIKCDQEFPSCLKCARVKVPCVSLDPATGRDVPRSYVMFLEDRLKAIMDKLRECGIDPSDVQGNLPATSSDNPSAIQLFEESQRKEHEVRHDNKYAAYLINQGTSMQRGISSSSLTKESQENATKSTPETFFPEDSRNSEQSESNKNFAATGSLKNNASNSYLGDSSGIPFAKLVFTAVNFKPDSVTESSDDEIKLREERYEDYAKSESSTDFDPLWLPPRNVAESLITRYFVDSNTQLPVLHREFFLKKYFEPIYGPWNITVSIVSDHTRINTAFKLPSNVSGGETEEPREPWFDVWLKKVEAGEKNIQLPRWARLPYFFLNMIFAIGHAVEVLRSDINHVVSFKRRAVQFSEELYASDDRMEALAGTILTAIYSLMRPNVPGVWYTMGSALRLTVDLGLHAEKINKNYDPFTRELRRRLFWCVYSLDRQICAYFGRPFGIPEESISARYPSLLDDALITTFNDDIEDYSKVQTSMATSKVIALAFFKVRRIQANVLQVLYAEHGDIPRRCPDLETWRSSVHSLLEKWLEKDVPKTYRKMNCKFNMEFFHLNYYQTKCMLYGLSPKNLSLSPKAFSIVYENTKGTISTYDKMCSRQKINFTWVTVHNLFMAGMTYLYVVYYSDRGINEGQQYVEGYTASILRVLKELIGTCEAAKNCFVIYKVLSAVVISLKFDMPQLDLMSKASVGHGIMSNGMTASETNLSPIERVGNNPGDMPKMSTAKQESTESFGVPLDQFFAELENAASASENESSNGHLSSVNSPLFTDGQRNHTKPVRMFAPAKDGQRIIDMISQVTTESIWDEFFGKAGASDTPSASDNVDENDLTNS